jgi:hypothetical protein
MYPWEGVSVNREDEGWQICWMYFVFLYETRTMKLFEIVLKRREVG